MSDTPDAQGDFAIDRLAPVEDDPKRVEPREERAAEAAPPENASSAAIGDDNFPDRVRRKYFVVADGQGKEGAARAARFYADERGEYLAFKVTEDRLITRLTAAEVIRDMIAVAEHRNWQALQIRGSEEFRREAWLEASARGMEVKGYEPTEIDRQALASRREASERAERRTPEAWRRATRGKAKPSERLDVRRGDVDRVPKNVTAIDAANDKARIERRQVSPSRSRATAEKFRSADRKAAARDAELVGMQSQLAIIEKALERAFPDDRQARERIMEAARERIAQHLEQGRSFARAMVREPVRDRNRPGGDRDDARRNPDKAQEKTRQRER
jgi:hypothetical protein